MKAIFLVALLTVAAFGMPHDHHAGFVHRTKDLLTRMEHAHRAHSKLATSGLRVPAKVGAGAAVTFESYSTDQTCGGTPTLSLPLTVGTCHVVCPGFAVNVTEFVQPPTNPSDASGLCASMSTFSDSACASETAVMNYQCKTCQNGEFWADCGGVFGALFMHSTCSAPSVSAPTCTSCNSTTITTFNQCKAVPSLGYVKASKLERCSTGRVDFLHNCDSPSQVYQSYSLSQGQCMAGIILKAGN